MQGRTGTNLLVGSQKSCRAGRVLVLGLGNILLKDEGVGVHVVEQLQKQSLPGNVEVVDGGTAGLDVLLLNQGIDKLVVIDAVRADKKPGTIYKVQFKTKELDKLNQIFSHGSKISLHQVALLDALSIAERTNCAPKEIVIIGVEPGEVDCGLELTGEVKRRIPDIVNTVLSEIKDDIHREQTNR